MSIEIDLSALEAIRSLGEEIGKPLLDEVVGLYCMEAMADLALMEEALERSEFQKIRSSAHTMSGASFTLGVKSIGARASELEAAAGCEIIDSKKVRVLVATIREELDPAINELRRLASAGK